MPHAAVLAGDRVFADTEQWAAWVHKNWREKFAEQQKKVAA